MTPGTIVAFYGTDPMSLLIRAATLGPSHVGIMSYSERLLNLVPRSELVLFESTTLCPVKDLATGEFVDGVQANRLSDRLATYPGKVVAYHLHEDISLDALSDIRLMRFLDSQLGKNYDYTAAALSASHLLKLRWNTPDLDTIFCSALVARALMIINRCNWSNPEWYSPAALINEIRKSAVYRKVERLN